ncbi:MAG: WG repeat-containing protein [Lachnospiraceae bacterium]|nr:WG repeat-containing protein [Lachnospiraceae bacterium]
MIKYRKLIGLLCLILGLAGCGKEVKTSNETILEASQAEEVYRAEAEESPMPGGTAVDTEESIEEDKEDVITPQYPIVARPSFTDTIEFAFDSEGIYCIYNGEKYGYMTNDGTEITEYIYDYASPFSEGLACVLKDGKYGFINKDGETELPFIYDDAAPFSEGLAYFVTDGKYGFMKPDGTIAFYLDCDSVSSFKEGLAYFSIDGKYGYIDTSGQIVIEPVYFDADYFEDGLAFVRVNGCEGVINTVGELVIPSDYVSIRRTEEFFIAEDANSCTYYTLDGERVLHNAYEDIVVADGYGYLVKINGLYGLLDETEDVLIAPAYEYLSIIEGTDCFIAKRDGAYGVIDIKGEEKVSFVYDWIYAIQEPEKELDGLLKVMQGDKYGCLSIADFSVVFPVEYDAIYTTDSGIFKLVKDSVSSLMNENGEIYMEYEAGSITVLENNAIVQKSDDVISLFSSDGTLLFTGKGNSIEWKDDYYLLNKDSGYVFLNAEGIQYYNIEFSYAASDVYGQREVYILHQWDGNIRPDVLIKLQESEDANLQEVLLQNKITPKIEKYWEVTRGETMIGVDFGFGTLQETTACDYRELMSFRLYDIKDEKFPVLYYYSTAYTTSNFPYSTSALLIQAGEGIKTLVSGHDCGGSMRGDYVCFWLDKETGELLLGTDGAVGGFGGIGRYDHVYSYEEGTLTEVHSSRYYSQTAGNYSDEDLYENAELFYDDNGIPFTPETILEASDVNEYILNEERVTKEEYDKVQERYIYISMYHYR